jgi:hypothetical protein
MTYKNPTVQFSNPLVVGSSPAGCTFAYLYVAKSYVIGIIKMGMERFCRTREACLMSVLWYSWTLGLTSREKSPSYTYTRHGKA